MIARRAIAFALLLGLAAPLAAAGQEASPQVPDEQSESPATLVVRVDVSGAVDPLVRFKTRQGQLQILLDGEAVVERSDRKAPEEDVYEAVVPAGDHELGLRWSVTFRSATDRHHPTAPRELGFSVPEYGHALHVVSLQPGDTVVVVARLHRKATVGIQGRSWVEWEEVSREGTMLPSPEIAP